MLGKNKGCEAHLNRALDQFRSNFSKIQGFDLIYNTSFVTIQLDESDRIDQSRLLNRNIY